MFKKISEEQLSLFNMCSECGCENCGVVKLDDNAQRLLELNENVCKDCLESFGKEKSVCYACDNVFEKDDMSQISTDDADEVAGGGSIAETIENALKLVGERNQYVCNDCHGTLFFWCDVCEDSGIAENALQIYDRSHRPPSFYIHEKCLRHSDYVKCESCDEIMRADESFTCDHDGDNYGSSYCEDCFSENCKAAGPDLDHLNEVERSTTLKSSGIPVSSAYIQTFKKILLEILESSSESLISNPKNSLLKDKIKAEANKHKKENNPRIHDEMYFLLNYLFDGDNVIRDRAVKILDKVDVEVAYQSELQQHFPNISQKFLYKQTPVRFRFSIEESYSDQEGSFTLTALPTNEMKELCFDTFKSLFDNSQDKAHDLSGLKQDINSVYSKYFDKGHHSGAVAYARVSVDEDKSTWVISNLQRDADFNSVKHKISDNELELSIAKWFERVIKENWETQLIAKIRAMAKYMKIQHLYMTPFEMQKERWSNIPEKSVEVYNKIPEMLGGQKEKADVRLNDFDAGSDLWRLANTKNRIERIRKLKGLFKNT